MKKKIILGLLVCGLVCMFSSCEGEGSGLGKGLVGYYTDLSLVAKTSDFDEINEAIRNNELLYTSEYTKEKYYATPELFMNEEGMWTDFDHHHGRFRFYIKDILFPVIHIVNDNTLKMQSPSCFLYFEGYGNGEEVYKLYAGPIFGNMAYICYGWRTFTYTHLDTNKIIVSNGDIYTIVNGGIIKDGSSVILTKYNPTILH